LVFVTLSTVIACGPGGTGEESAESKVGSVGTVVETAKGALEGAYVDASEDVLVFRGIRYARPPVGELRWRPPQPPEAWEGTRSAAEAGLPCWQPHTAVTSIYSRGEIERGEDCLNLNLWTPATSTADGLPVMVWFHGGGHNTGHGSSLVFDGTALARKGVVLVSANYRLGAIGFLAHPALTAESSHGSSGNYGILDHIATLEWVRDNVAAFGGNPDNVLIFGQSAGSASVCTLEASPLAHGLFHKAIGHSGSCTRPRTQLDVRGPPEETSPSAHDLGLALAAALGIVGSGPEAAAALREVDPGAILEASRTPGARSPGIQVDGWVVPRQMRDIFEAGEHNKVPSIIGWMADEGKGLYATLPARSMEEFESGIRQRYGELAEEVLSAYAEEAKESTKVAQQSIQADAAFGMASRTWARLVADGGSDAYYYFFTQAPPVFNLYLPDRPPMEIPEGPRGYGAYHSGDLAYAFGNLHLVGYGWNDDDREVSEAMSQYWVNFAKTGDPNGEGLPTWPRYEASSDQGIELGVEIGVITGVRKAKLDIFEAIAQQ
jgi:para-nitrobenzyl esterase